jgi:hypothetical protein
MFRPGASSGADPRDNRPTRCLDWNLSLSHAFDLRELFPLVVEGRLVLRDFRLGRVCEAVDRRRIPQCVGLLKEGCAPLAGCRDGGTHQDGRWAFGSGVLAVGWILQGQACTAETVMPQDVGSHTLREFRLGRVCEAVDRRKIAQCDGLLKKGCAPLAGRRDGGTHQDGRWTFGSGVFAVGWIPAKNCRVALTSPAP